MPNGFGFRGGWGFGFRGSSPPWPFIGLGRGGLPRCGYFLSGAAGMPVAPTYGSYPYYGSPGYYGNPAGAPFYGSAAPYPGGTTPFGSPPTSQMTREQELDLLRSQADAIKAQLEQIENRIRELGSEE